MVPISRREGLFLMLGASQGVLLGAASAADSTPYSAKVSSRSPKLWMKLDEASGTPVDSSGNSLSVTLNGTPRAYRIPTSKGPGIDLGGNADIQIAHNAVFETDHGIPRDVSGHAWVYSEVALVGQFKINDFTDGEDTYLFGKSDSPGAWAHSLNVWVTSDRRLRINARTPWRHVRLDSPAHAITRRTSSTSASFSGARGCGLPLTAGCSTMARRTRATGTAGITGCAASEASTIARSASARALPANDPTSWSRSSPYSSPATTPSA